MRKETAREFLARRAAERQARLRPPFTPIQAFDMPLYDVPEKHSPPAGKAEGE